MSFRTPQTQSRYHTYRSTLTSCTPCFLCVNEDTAYDQWKLVKNAFPYDLVVIPETHFLLCPKRHVAEEGDLNNMELMERDRLIREVISKKFSCIMLNFEPARTHKSHLHYHVWVNKGQGLRSASAILAG